MRERGERSRHRKEKKTLSRSGGRGRDRSKEIKNEEKMANN